MPHLNNTLTLISPSCFHTWCVREAVTGPMAGSEGMLTLLLESLSPAPFTAFTYYYATSIPQLAIESAVAI